jgi:hypothetical protein
MGFRIKLHSSKREARMSALGGVFNSVRPFCCADPAAIEQIRINHPYFPELVSKRVKVRAGCAACFIVAD